MRVATIDIGTNTVLLLVADRGESGSLVSVSEGATITRLGQGVDQNRRLSPAAIARTTECLRGYAEILQNLRADRVAVVGTSAMRDASGGQELTAQVQALFGVVPRVLTGAEEARLAFRGALGGLALSKVAHAEVAVFDIGGGSTEVVIGRRDVAAIQIDYATSFDVGSVRLTERHVRRDPPSPSELEALRLAAAQTFVAVPQLSAAQPVIGIAGTMTTLAAVALRLVPYDGARVHGHTLVRDELRRTVDELAALPLARRREVPGMEPDRADVIVAGGHIATALLDHWDVNEVIVSDRGVRWGLAEELSAAET